ncbi:MAG: hypothetical protein ACKVVT_13650 [Dehalococcoidia bacterium]
MTVPGEAALSAVLGPGVVRDGGRFETEAGASWEVREADLDGAHGDAAIAVLIRSGEGVAPSVWLGSVAARWVILDDAGLAAYFAAHRSVPLSSCARLLAASRSPRGGERVLLEDEEVESLLAELAPLVGPSDRAFNAVQQPEAWEFEFLGAALRQSSDDHLWRLTVARWEVRFTADPPQLSWQRREILSDALLARYRP